MQSGSRRPEEEQGEVVEQDKVRTLQSQVEGVKDIMTQNVDRILARGERLDDLMGKSEDLQAGAEDFKHTSQKVARSYWWKNMKLWVVIVVIVLVIILIIVLLSTGVIPTSSPVPPLPKPTKRPN
ncbi:vesicle-associated membrane protein 8 isoform X1 [Oncorhynchus mykiss]|uniref:vesicle-associated membrane protein 8 isoform X1 n=1 Tax=Oncorhynchus mykiss TaxID=8022 RepID=UPI000B4EDAEB|nr:vesicle-associated membrane protein 8 isoform X1 [Oncorhynchus mykiss]